MKNFIGSMKRNQALIIPLLTIPFFVSQTIWSQSDAKLYGRAVVQSNTEIIRQAPAEALCRCKTVRANSSLLHIAARLGNFTMAQILAEKCPELLTQQNARGETPLKAALLAKQYDVALWLLEQKTELSKITDKKDTPLDLLLHHYAKDPNLQHHSDAYWHLLGQLIQTADPETPQWYLFCSENQFWSEIIRYLIDQKYLDVTQLKDAYGNSCLHKIKEPFWVSILIQAEVDPDATNDQNNLPVERICKDYEHAKKCFSFELSEKDHENYRANITQLLPWTTFRAKTATEIKKIKTDIARVFGTDALEEMKKYHRWLYTQIERILLSPLGGQSASVQIPADIVDTILMPFVMRSPDVVCQNESEIEFS